MTVGEQTRQQKILRLLRTFATDPKGVSRALPGLIRQRHGTRAALCGRRGLGRASPRPARRDLALPAEPANSMSSWPISVPCWRRTGSATAAIPTAVTATPTCSLCRAVWCTVMHAQPGVVIETGVAHGVTSRIVLEALNQNDRGHLWSIDLPHPFDHRLHVQTGAAVTDDCRPRWSYLEGVQQAAAAAAGRRGRPRRDCSSTTACTRPRTRCSRCEQAASVMPPGGVMLVDDIRTHEGFATFARRAS